MTTSDHYPLDMFYNQGAYIQITLVKCQVHNRPSESNFKAFQNLVGEHSIAGVPASLYNITKRVPDPYTFIPFYVLSRAITH